MPVGRNALCKFWCLGCL